MEVKPFRRSMATPLKDGEKKTATRVLGNFADFFAGITDTGSKSKTTQSRDEGSERTERRSEGRESKGSRRVIVEKHVHHHYHDRPEPTAKKSSHPRRRVKEDDEDDMFGVMPSRNILLEDEKGNDTGLAKKLKKHRDITDLI